MRIIKLASILLCTSIILTGCAKNNGNLALRINNIKITKSEFNKMFLQTKRAFAKLHIKTETNTTQLKRNIMNNFIQVTLINLEMEKRNLTASEEEIKQRREQEIKQLGSEEAYNKHIKINKLTPEQEKEGLAYQIKIEKLTNIIAKPKVTDAEIKKFYNDNKYEFYVPEKIRFSQIFLKTNYAAVKKELIDEDKKMQLSTEEIDKISRETITKNEELLKVLQSKVTVSNFAEIAKAYSQDESAKNGGDMGFVSRDEISHILYDELSKRKVGEIGPAIETAKGSHIVLVKDKSAQTYVPLETVRADIAVRILENKRTENYDKMIDALIANAEIVIYDKTLKEGYISPIEAFFNRFKKRK